MATFRLSATVVKRSVGRSATAAAAYRSGTALHDRRIDRVFDYTRRRGVLHTEIVTPPNTPNWMRDRARLWNAVEAVEKRKDAQLAREVLLALPHELTHEQRLELVRKFASEEFVAHGMIADLAVHSPDRKGDQRNHHAHILLTMREITGAGFGQKERDWNATEQLEGWRAHWADAVNRALEQYGHAARVDHRSLKEQGVDREPEPKMGPVATDMERQGKPSHAGRDRRAVHSRNRRREQLKTEAARLLAEIADLDAERDNPEGDTSMADAIATEEGARAAIEQRKAEVARQQARREEAERADRLAQDQADRLAAQPDELRLEHERLRARQKQIDDYNAEQRRIAEAVRKRQAEEEAEAKEGEIRDAKSRYAEALGDYDIRSPYTSLARASMNEYKTFRQERQDLTRQIAAESDPAKRKTLELRQEIELCDYMSITSHRIAGQSEIIVGRSNTDEAVRQRAQAREYEERAKELRAQYRERIAEQQRQQDDEPEKTAEPSRAYRQRGPRSSRGRSDRTRENDPEAGELDRSSGAERLRAQRGEQSQKEGEQPHHRGPDLER